MPARPPNAGGRDTRSLLRHARRADLGAAGGRSCSWSRRRGPGRNSELAGRRQRRGEGAVVAGAVSCLAGRPGGRVALSGWARAKRQKGGTSQPIGRRRACWPCSCLHMPQAARRSCHHERALITLSLSPPHASDKCCDSIHAKARCSTDDALLLPTAALKRSPPPNPPSHLRNAAVKMDANIQKALNDKLYDKRKAGALECVPSPASPQRGSSIR